jgi:hypothetical protein
MDPVRVLACTQFRVGAWRPCKSWLRAPLPSPQPLVSWLVRAVSGQINRHLLLLTSRQAAEPDDLLLANRRPPIVSVSTVHGLRSLSGLFAHYGTVLLARRWHGRNVGPGYHSRVSAASQC